MNDDRQKKRKTSPARTPEAQERLMINLSMQQAEDMLRQGRAPAPVVVHFLKLATERQKFEVERLKAETELAKSKAEVLAAQKHSDELYEQAIAAFRSYGGAFANPTGPDDFDGEYYDD